jgi:hypothetical protein
MRSIWIQALICLVRGHHDLSLAAAYGEMPPRGFGMEFYYCARCGRTEWMAKRRDESDGGVPRNQAIP